MPFHGDHGRLAGPNPLTSQALTRLFRRRGWLGGDTTDTNRALLAQLGIDDPEAVLAGYTPDWRRQLDQPQDVTAVAPPVQEMPPALPQHPRHVMGPDMGQGIPLPQRRDAVFPSFGEGPADVALTALSRAYENVERFGAGFHKTVGQPLYGVARGAAAMWPGGMPPGEGWQAG